MIRLRIVLTAIPFFSLVFADCGGPCQAQYQRYGPVPIGYYARSNAYLPSFRAADDTPVEILSNKDSTTESPSASESSKASEAEEYEKKLAELKLLRADGDTADNTIVATPQPSSAFLPTYSRSEVYTRPLPYRPQPQGYSLPPTEYQQPPPPPPPRYTQQPVPIFQTQYTRIPQGCPPVYYPQYPQPPRYFPQPMPPPPPPTYALPQPTPPPLFQLPTLPPPPPPPPNPFLHLNDCCGRCHSPCRSKSKRVAAGVTSHLANNEENESSSKKDPKCTNEDLRKIMNRHITNTEQLSKRLIQKQAEEKIGGFFFVVCTRDDFSYVSRAEDFCTAEKNGIVCYAFQHR